ncbi:chemotaxis response regulator protein-glutamate methylesterase [Heliorestis acidaminivorans]|uniref:Protein-glutamate methylesterase/protein-glutamine glutaminase n=1 Tax=Heliorestis acidaminivorans TaxID=553427 RepID=A0A6I0EX38_9FIRM|nr:chemotaxis response regulator protein-glutamate methylesterase [Heliorestis acidaminivorans]KAB2954379.1 chemotaxis response regulator protein-glutamate methylesterase [Heliorestis acidaminivorans]
MSVIKVLVVDDSAFMRKVISDMIAAESGMIVVGTARNGQDALHKIEQLSPDVVTMDIEMPILDGLSTLEKIMSEKPVPVIMLSSLTQQGAESTLQALQKGAVDFIPKPSGTISLDIHKVRDELLSKIKIAAMARIRTKPVAPRKWSAPPASPSPKPSTKKITIPLMSEAKEPNTYAGKVSNNLGGLNKIILIGTSTGGPKALYEVIPKLPRDLDAAVLVVQHMPPGFTRSLAERLDANSPLKVKEAEHNEEIRPGVVYIAPGDYHLKVQKTEKPSLGKQLWVRLTQEPPAGGHRPSVNVMMTSVVDNYWSKIVGVIMTGMGSDGAEGIKLIKSQQGKTIAEDASTCIVYGMPKVAIESGYIDKVAPLTELADEITRSIRER